MTTKLIITSIAILTSMTVGIVALTQVYKSNTKVAMVSSSSSVLSSLGSVASSSTAVQSSSVVAGVESTTPKPAPSVETPPKVVESKKATQNNYNCNLSESENLIKTDDGCFELGVSVNTFSTTDEDVYHPKYSNELKNVTSLAAKDYYSKVKSKIVTKKIVVYIAGTKKISETKFELFISIGDPDYLQSQGYDTQSDRTRFNATYYLIYENNKWQTTFNKESSI